MYRLILLGLIGSLLCHSSGAAIYVQEREVNVLVEGYIKKYRQAHDRAFPQSLLRIIGKYFFIRLCSGVDKGILLTTIKDSQYFCMSKTFIPPQWLVLIKFGMGKRVYEEDGFQRVTLENCGLVELLDVVNDTMTQEYYGEPYIPKSVLYLPTSGADYMIMSYRSKELSLLKLTRPMVGLRNGKTQLFPKKCQHIADVLIKCPGSDGGFISVGGRCKVMEEILWWKVAPPRLIARLALPKIMLCIKDFKLSNNIFSFIDGHTLVMNAMYLDGDELVVKWFIYDRDAMASQKEPITHGMLVDCDLCKGNFACRFAMGRYVVIPSLKGICLYAVDTQRQYHHLYNNNYADGLLNYTLCPLGYGQMVGFNRCIDVTQHCIYNIEETDGEVCIRPFVEEKIAHRSQPDTLRRVGIQRVLVLGALFLFKQYYNGLTVLHRLQY